MEEPINGVVNEARQAITRAASLGVSSLIPSSSLKNGILILTTEAFYLSWLAESCNILSGFSKTKITSAPSGNACFRFMA